MPRTCTICSHPDRLPIERELIGGTSLRDIAVRFGTAKTSIARHRSHVLESMTKNALVRDMARTGVLIDDVRAGERRAELLYDRAEEILASAVRDGDQRTAIQAIRAAVTVMGEARSYMTLRGELTNELGRDRTPPQMSIQIICPQSDAGLPQIRFAADSSTSGALSPRGQEIESDFEEIGLLQGR